VHIQSALKHQEPAISTLVVEYNALCDKLQVHICSGSGPRQGMVLSYPRFSQVQLRPSEPTLAHSGLVHNSETLELGYASTLVLSIRSYYLSPNVLVSPPCIIHTSAPPSGTLVPGALLSI
jgi:hypothetical protein